MPSHRQKQDDVEAQLHDQTNLLSTRQLIIVFSVMASTLLVTFIDQNGIGTCFNVCLRPTLVQLAHMVGFEVMLMGFIQV
jgi:hypothetical protein